MSASDEERIQFVKDLDLAVSLASGPLVGDSSESAAVDQGSMIAFTPDVQDQMRSDVLNSMLFAQLAANRVYHRQNQTKEWYEFYRSVLEKVGWATQSFDLAHLSDADTYSSVDKLVIQLATKYLSGSELALFTTMVESLKDDANKTAQKVFDSYSKSSNKANFQLGVTSNSSGNPTLKLGGYTYEASQIIDHVLFFTFDSQKVSFYAGNQTMVLDEKLYATVRQAVLMKVNWASNQIRDIELGSSGV